MKAPPLPPPASKPTIYFVGVTTGQSSILEIFPRWAGLLGIPEARIVGVDFPLHAPAEDYRALVRFLRDDPGSRGALVTTHKIDLFAACRELFAAVDPLAAATQETSCLSKRPADGALVCHAKDPVSSGLALEAFFPARRWAEPPGAEAFLIGAGGAAVAITHHLLVGSPARPRRIVVADRAPERLDEIRRLHRQWGEHHPDTVAYELVRGPRDNDALLAARPAGSLVVNATGLGKDGPGSPLTDAARFPEGASVWELNYRGERRFLAQARAQATVRGLTLEDGWTYFVHGWTRVLAEVFHRDIPTAGPLFERLSAAAAAVGRPAAPSTLPPPSPPAP